jgi:hypothetical protein
VAGAQVPILVVEALLVGSPLNVGLDAVVRADGGAGNRPAGSACVIVKGCHIFIYVDNFKLYLRVLNKSHFSNQLSHTRDTCSNAFPRRSILREHVVFREHRLKQ